MPGSLSVRQSVGVTGSWHGLASQAGGLTSVLTARSAESMAILMVQLRLGGGGGSDRPFWEPGVKRMLRARALAPMWLGWTLTPGLYMALFPAPAGERNDEV